MEKLSEELLSLNDKTAKAMIPTVVYIGTLMVVGLSGNPLVIYFYSRKVKVTPSHIFIVTLAIFDILTCLISMPFEIADMIQFYTFESHAACKVLCFCNYFFSLGSASILIAIAVDRYRKVCKPLKSQLNMVWCKVAIVISISFAVISAAPSALFYNVVEVNVTLPEGNISILGYDCTLDRDESNHLLIILYNIYELSLFVGTVSVLGTLYSLIGRKLSRVKSSQRYLRSTHAHLVSSRKVTIIMLVITIAFVVGFLPHLGLVAWRTISKKYEASSLSDAEHVAFQIGLRSYFLGCVCNPFIYGLFNSQFRTFIKSVCHRTDEGESSTDDNNAKWLKKNVWCKCDMKEYWKW